MNYLELQRERLKKYLAAEEAILINQEYTIGSRKYTRTDLAEVRRLIGKVRLQTFGRERAVGQILCRENLSLKIKKPSKIQVTAAAQAV